MHAEFLTQFFMWCTTVNGGLLSIWGMAFLLIPDLVYRTQTWVFPMPRETYNVAMYSFLAVFKILFLIFNAVPYVALRIMGAA